MDNLPQLYYDVRIVTVQLEYLLEIARAALQPWLVFVVVVRMHKSAQLELCTSLCSKHLAHVYTHITMVTKHGNSCSAI